MYELIEVTNNVNNHKFVDIIEANNKEQYFGKDSIMKRALAIFYPENFSRKTISSGTLEEMNTAYKEYAVKHKIIYSPDYYNYPKTKEEKQQFIQYSNQLAKEAYIEWKTTHKQLYQTDEFKQKISKASAGELNGMYGRKHTEESKQKMSLHSKGKTLGEKNGNYGMVGEKAKNGKAIYQYRDAEHSQLVQRFNTVSLALEYLGLKGHGNLYKAINNNTEYRGYYWSR